jgi:NAD(P)-dependent dehydrogenase (short-subunit alcohol dehydrogenase family)
MAQRESVVATKPVLVTGASSGIGWTVTESLSGAGHLVYAGVRSRKDFDSLRKLPNVHPIIMDVTKPVQVKRGVEEIRRAGKGLFGLVNNAGIIDYWPLVELEDEELKRSFEVNVFGVQRVVREAIPLLLESRGRIVNISSLEGLASTKFAGPYEMTKFALEAYSDSLSKELKSHGVSVILVEPGEFRTNYAKTTEKLLARRARTRAPIVMKKEVEIITKTWHKFASYVASRAAPTLVAAEVLDALSSEKPKHRYVVTTNPNEFRWALNSLMSKLIEVNRGYGRGLSKKELHRLLDDAWSRSRG